MFLIPNFGVFFSSAIFLSRRSRLSRTSRASSRLIRPRPIDCDREREQTVKSFPVLGFLHRQKNVFQHVPILIYTPKEAHGRIYVTGGSVFTRQMLAKKKARLGATSLYFSYKTEGGTSLQAGSSVSECTGLFLCIMYYYVFLFVVLYLYQYFTQG